ERKSLEGILDRTAKRVDIVNALKLSSFLNLNPEKFINIYLTEMSPESIGELERARKLNFIASNFDLKNLYKAKFIDSKTDFDKIECRIKSFFGIENIFQYNDQKLYPLFSRTKRSSNNKMRDFWVRSAYSHFQKINNKNEFDRAALVSLLPKIRQYTMDTEKGLFVVAQALYNIGITIIYQPYLPTVQVRGATFFVNNKPCIVLTDLQKNYPTIWFALIHEIHHILYDLEIIQTNAYHLSGELDLFLIGEDEANDFSREYLFSEEKSKYIAPFINNELIVREFAKKSQVHPSLIYSFYNYDRNNQGYHNAWSKYKQYFPDIKKTLERFNTNPWEKETIQESVDMIKEAVFNII
ncbi:MAG: hypothetical protein WCK63_19000, partial [Betaproteobacteria bacterium]